MQDNTTIAGEFQRMLSKRDAFERRAEDCARYTLPALFVPEGHTDTTTLREPYQSIGSRGVNNLASKLLVSFFPPGVAPIRLVPDEYQLEQVAGIGQASAEIQRALRRQEKAVQSELETTGLRAIAHEAFRQLVIAGNALVYLPDDLTDGRVYTLRDFVCLRDPQGRLIKIITRESVAFSALSSLEQEHIVAEKGDDISDDAEFELYTLVSRIDEDTFEVAQEVAGKIIESTEGTYKEDSLPWIAVRWNRVSGESYGRSYVEEYLGDLRSLDWLQKAVVEASAASARLLWLVRPNAMVSVKDLAGAPNGAFIEGQEGDATALQVGKQADLSVTYSAIQGINERLAYAFALNSAVRRSGERVTAEEIRYMAQELQDLLSGAYTVISREFQVPFIRRVMQRMTDQKRLPELPEDVVSVQVVGGVEAMGRGHDRTRLLNWAQSVASVAGPQAMAQYANAREFMERLAHADGLQPEGLVKSEQELAQERQQMMQQQMAAQAVPGVLKETTKAMVSGNTQPPQQ